MIDFGSDRPVHRQLADIIRADIAAGRLEPGRALPSEGRLMQEYELGRVAVRQALGVLRSEGLIVTVKREGSYVRPQAPVERVVVEGPAEVTARMPSQTSEGNWTSPRVSRYSSSAGHTSATASCLPTGQPSFGVQEGGRTHGLTVQTTSKQRPTMLAAAKAKNAAPIWS